MLLPSFVSSWRLFPLCAVLIVFLGPELEAAPAGSPPIPVRFRLEKPGYVTLAIDDAEGKRVRNLLGETWFSAGEHVVAWDGMDDLGRAPEINRDGIFYIPRNLVAAGRYTVHGLVRDALDLRFDMAPYTNGNPPWTSADRASDWLSNHAPPSAVLFVPPGEAPDREVHPAPDGQILVGSWVSEGKSGLAWLDTDGRKIHGQVWVGGVWTGATHLARDEGSHRVPEVYAYSAAPWKDELRIYELVKPAAKGAAPNDRRMGTGEDRPVLKTAWKFPEGTPDLTDKGPGVGRGLGGFAVHDGLIVASLPVLDRMLFIDGHEKKVLGEAPIRDPRGVAFDRHGRLLVLSGSRLLRFQLSAEPTKLSAPEVLVSGLDDPQGISVAPDEAILVTDCGHSHQVKIFSNEGKPAGILGKGGVPRSGPYDPERLTNPYGVTVDDQGRIWVAEKDKQPKRVSIWTRDGKLVKAFYGPMEYGGGGEIDPRDPSRFYYFGMELRLDRERKTSAPTAILCRRDDPETEPLLGDWPPLPQTAFYHGGHRYLTNCYSSNPTNGAPYAILWQADGAKAREVAACGAAIRWGAFGTLFAPKERFSARWTGQIVPRFSETYTFQTLSDSSVRVWVDGKLVFDRWGERSRGEGSGEIALEANRPVSIRIEHANYGGPALLQLAWSSPSQLREIVPSEALLPGAYVPGHGLKVQFYRESDIEKSDVRNPLVEGILANVDADFTNGAPLDEHAKRFVSRLPADVHRDRDPVFFLWSDTNGNGHPDTEEVTFTKGASGGITVMPDLSLVVSRLNEKTMRWQPVAFSSAGTPHYDIARSEVLAEDVQRPTSSGGDQALIGHDGWTVLTVAPKPFAPQGFGGVKDGQPRWTYPSLWPGLHASHQAPLLDEPATPIGTTRLLGGLFTTPVGEVFAINGNKGNVYLLTSDGLFVATLFADSRRAAWDMEKAEPGLRLNEHSLGEESFWPHITQTEKGEVFLSANGVLVRLEGLETLKRLSEQTIDVTPAMLTAVQETNLQQAHANQPPDAKTSLRALPFKAVAKIDGNLDEWKDADWGTIDSRLVTGSRKKMETQAAIAVSNDRLYAAWKTGDPKLLRNSGEVIRNLFKSGGALDLQLEAVPGGIRLLVAEVDGKPIAVVFQPKDPQRRGDPVEYTSNVGLHKTVKIDRVEIVTDQVEIGSDGKGNYEVSVPWSVLRLSAPPQGKLRADLGLLRGNGTQTLQRVYWRNKASGLVSDLATEAELEPRHWGDVEFAERK